jgi:iron complex outermembrane recepter protein
MKLPTLQFSTANHSLRLVAFFAFIGLFLTETHAQQIAKEESEKEKTSSGDKQIVKLDAFTVTDTSKTGWNSQQTFSGSRVAQNIMDVPVSINIINENYIKALGATSLFDVINYSAASVNSRVSYRDDFTIRGFRESPTLDGISFGSLDKTPLWDIDRIEVVNGPTALVYGNASVLGGTINYVTKRPNQGTKTTGDVGLLAGIDGRNGANATVRGPFTKDGKIRYRVTGGYSNYDGFRESEFENYRLISASVDWSIAENFEVRFDAGGHNSHRGDFNRAMVDPATKSLAKLPDAFTTSSEWGYVDYKTFRARMEAIYTPSQNFSARLLLNSFEGTYEYEVAQPYPGLKLAEAPNFLTVGQRYLHYGQKTESRNFQGDINWDLDLGSLKNQVAAGFDQAVNDNLVNSPFYVATLADIIIAQPVSARAARPDTTVQSKITANNRASFSTGWTGYVNDAVTLFNDRLILSAGIRYITKGATTDGKARSVYRYGIVYKPTQNYSIFGSYGESFQPLTGKDILGRPYTDISGQNKEVGVKLNLFDGRIYGTVSYFDTFKDPVVTQVEVKDSNGNVLYGNVQTAKETNKGFEANLGTSHEVGNGKLMGYLTYYDADPLDAKGNRPARAVAKKSSLFSRYEFTKGSLKGFIIGAGVSNSGESVGTGIPIQPSYTLYTALVGYQAPQWSLMLNVDNLTDEKDAIMGSEANFSVYVARPRDIRLTYSYLW